MSQLPGTRSVPGIEAGPRYVIPFQTKRLPLLRWPIAVLGAGAAGASAALMAADAGVEVLVLAKPPASQSNTWRAQGGIAVVSSPGDSFEKHAADTELVGCGLSHPDVVRQVIEAGPETIRWLEELAVPFDHEPSGGHGLSREGGHSMSRVLSSGGDATGRAIQKGLLAALQSHPLITWRDDLRAVDLLVSEGTCIGLIAVDSNGEAFLVRSSQTILATGAAGQIYRETTNPAVATGDGLAMAYRAGASLRDLEFVQFHPTTLYIAGAARVLISEAVRGAGAVLIDRNGQRVMEGKHESLDLAPRDVVSRAILQRMVETGDTHVYLDASRIPGDVRARFPQIAQMCAAFHIDISRDPIPVRPGAHYNIGGVVTDLDGATDIPGLFACGEVASSGLHGANRLASNSLLEAIVIGRASGMAASSRAEKPSLFGVDSLDEDPAAGAERSAPGEVELHHDDMLYSLKSRMWRQAGLIRNAGDLEDCLGSISFWAGLLLSRPERHAKYVDLINMLLVSRLSTASALCRRESRGTHFRSDFPEKDDSNWRLHSLVRRLQPSSSDA